MNKYEITIYYDGRRAVVRKCKAPTFEYANKKFAKYLKDPEIEALKVEKKGEC